MRNVVKTNSWDRMDWDELRRQWHDLHPIEELWDAGCTTVTLDSFQMEDVVGWLHLVYVMVREQGLDMDEDPDDPGEAEAEQDRLIAERELALDEQERAREYWGEDWRGQGIPDKEFPQADDVLVQPSDLPMTDMCYTLNGGGLCPNCGRGSGVEWCGRPNDVIDTTDTQNRVYMRTKCTHCTARWVEIYHLVGYTDLETEEDT